MLCKVVTLDFCSLLTNSTTFQLSDFFKITKRNREALQHIYQNALHLKPSCTSLASNQLSKYLFCSETFVVFTAVSCIF